MTAPTAVQRIASLRTRADFLTGNGVLLVTRDPPPAPPPPPGQPAAVPGHPAEGASVSVLLPQAKAA